MATNHLDGLFNIFLFSASPGSYCFREISYDREASSSHSNDDHQWPNLQRTIFRYDYSFPEHYFAIRTRMV